jgi:hypothetical protein
MPAKTDPQPERAGSDYYYRRSLSAQQLLPAIGAGVAVGVAVFYVVRAILQRTPLLPEPLPPLSPVRRRAPRASSRSPGG